MYSYSVDQETYFVMAFFLIILLRDGDFPRASQGVGDA